MIGDYELDNVYCGDSFELMDGIPDNSIDLILTDPIYWNFDDYKRLAIHAGRILKDGGAVLAQVGEKFWFDAEVAFRSESKLDHLPPVIEVYYFSTRAFHMGPTKISSGYVPYVFAMNGLRKVTVMDRFFGKRDKTYHKWGDGTTFSKQYVDVLTPEDGIVFDPFCGGGTVAAAAKMMNRSFLAFDIDPLAVESTNRRLGMVDENGI